MTLPLQPRRGWLLFGHFPKVGGRAANLGLDDRTPLAFKRRTPLLNQRSATVLLQRGEIFHHVAQVAFSEDLAEAGGHGAGDGHALLDAGLGDLLLFAVGE